MKNKAFLVEYCRTEVSLSHPADYDVNCQLAATTRAFLWANTLSHWLFWRVRQGTRTLRWCWRLRNDYL